MNIIHIDDHPLFSHGLIAALNPLLPDSKITMVSNARDAIEQIEADPDLDLILLDLNMPGIHGLGFMRALLEKQINVPVAILSANEDVREIRETLELGAVAFIPKHWTHTDIAEALAKIEQGDLVIPDYIQDGIAKLTSQKRSDTNGLEISQRQIDVLSLMGQGLTNKEISDVLFIAESTVKSHIKALFQILNCKNRIDCVRKAQSIHII